MTLSTSPSQEDLSALFDGQLGSASDAQLREPWSGASDMAATWLGYQLIGQAMRGEVDDPAQAKAFLANFESRLAQEAFATEVVSAPVSVQRLLATPEQTASPADVVQKKSAPSRLKVFAALISAALSGALGLGVLQQTTMMQVAQTPLTSPAQQSAPASPVFVATDMPDRGVMIRDPALDELLLAHQLQGGHSALQMPSGFLRNATFESPIR